MAAHSFQMKSIQFWHLLTRDNSTAIISPSFAQYITQSIAILFNSERVKMYYTKNIFFYFTLEEMTLQNTVFPSLPHA